MAKTTIEYKKDIERALRAVGRYSKGLDAQVISLAGGMRTLAMANEEIDNLDCTTIEVTNRYGTESVAPHPVFRIQKDAQDSVTRQMKALGLTAESLLGQDENDPLVDLSKKVISAGRRKVQVLYPDGTEAR